MFMYVYLFILKMTENNNHIQEQTEKQQKKLAHTIAKKNESWISIGIRELMQTIWASSKKTDKKNKNSYQISEDMENYEKKLGEKRAPIN